MRPPSLQIPASFLVLVTTLAAVLLAGCAADQDPAGRLSSGGSPAGAPGGGAPAVGADEAGFPASDVLRAWDGARSRAFAKGDVRALRRLYVADSAAGTSDVRLLREYLRRGLRVEGMRMQVLALEVLREDPGRLVVQVTDRLTGAVAVDRGRRIRLPQDRASTRLVDLRRTGGRWRVASVRESARRRAGR